MEQSLYLFRRIRRLDHTCKQRVDQKFLSLELTGMQSYVLRYLEEHTGEVVYPKDIEQRFHLTHPTVSGLLARLEAKGFIVCSPDPDDRRCKRITATEKAEQCQREIHETFQALEREAMRGFSKEETETLLRLLDQALENISTGKEQSPL